MKMYRYFLPLFLGLLVANNSHAAERWYKTEQVDSGKKLFIENCASCHGQNAEATPNWKETGPDGKFPPPPLNGTAHAWHHPISILKRQIRKGGVPLGGSMPPFSEKLSASEIDDVIAYFQSKWPDKIYSLWEERQAASGKSVPARPVKNEESPILKLLSKRVPDGKFSKPEESPLPGIYQVEANNDIVYLSQDGKYAVIGELINLETGVNQTDLAKSKIYRRLLDGYKNAEKIIFPANEKEIAVIDILTDTSCQYCRKLHSEVPQLQKAGITVRYIPYPRGGKDGPGYKTLRSVWCSSDPVKAITDAKSGNYQIENTECDRGKLVDVGYRLGNQLGIQGTPVLFLPGGRMMEGYLPASRLIEMVRSMKK